VVFNCLEGLKVSVSDKGDALKVAPGYAIDGEGRDLYVPEAKEILIPDLQSFNPPTTVYISLRYNESFYDRREDAANPMYSGHAYVSEETVIEITHEKPDNYHGIELGQVRLSENPGRIRNAETPGGPGKAVVPAKPGGSGRRKAAVVPAAGMTGLRLATAPRFPADKLEETKPLDQLDLTRVPEAGAMTRTRSNALSLSDLGEKLIDTRVLVIEGNRKQEDTNILIEQYPKKLTPPMYLVSVQSLDGVRTRWSVESTENDEGSLDYTLHIRNESNRTTTIMCRVYRLRI
jgi:hypothetical protein